MHNLPKTTDESVAYMAKMRNAAQTGVTEADITGIVRAQVAKAKAGDAAAIKFVFERVIGGLGMDGATIVQENHYHIEVDEERKVRLAEPLPEAQSDRVKRMRERLDAGLDPVLPADVDGRDPEGDAVAGRRR